MQVVQGQDQSHLIHHVEDEKKSILRQNKIPQGRQVAEYASMTECSSRQGQTGRFACVTIITTMHTIVQLKRNNTHFIQDLMQLNIFIQQTTLITANTTSFVNQHSMVYKTTTWCGGQTRRHYVDPHLSEEAHGRGAVHLGIGTVVSQDGSQSIQTLAHHF